MIPHRRDHDVLMPRVPGEDGRDQRGGGGGGAQRAAPQPRDRGALPRQQQH